MVVSPNDPRIDQVGFAKLLGDGFELCAKKYEIVIGRHSKSSTVDVVLGKSTIALCILILFYPFTNAFRAFFLQLSEIRFT